VLLIPSFAIGRTQEVVWALDHLLDAGRIPKIKLYLDSPMASKATTIYREHTDYYDAETLALLNRGEGPIDFPDQQETPNAPQSEAIDRSQAAVRPRRLERHAHRRPRPQSPARR
jgi:metallo-beta-lactamase family protein